MKNFNKLTIITAVILATAVAASAAGLGEVDQAFLGATTSAKKMGGGALYTFLGFFPLIIAVVAMVGAGMYKINNKTDQETGLTIVFYGIGGAIAGAVLGIFMNMMIGAFLFGDTTKGATLFTQYWTSSITAIDADAGAAISTK